MPPKESRKRKATTTPIQGSESSSTQKGADAITAKLTEIHDENGDTFNHSSSSSNSEEESSSENHAAVAGESEGEGEDLFDPECLRQDYAPRADLDYYDPSMLDDSENIKPMRISDRRRAERELDIRDRLVAEMHGDVPTEFFGFTNFEDDHEDELWTMLRQRREKFREKADKATLIPVQLTEQAKEELPYCQSQSSWSQRVEEILQVIFTGFLCLYRRQSTTNEEIGGGDIITKNKKSVNLQDNKEVGEIEGYYITKLAEMALDDSTSLTIVWDDLRHYCPKVLDWLYQIPRSTLMVLDQVATKITREKYHQLYSNRKITCRIQGYTAVDTLRSLNTDSLQRLVCVRAVVIRVSNVIPKLKCVYFECNRCSCSTNGPYEQRDDEPLKVKPVCEDCQSTGPFTISRERTIYENYQRLTLQQQPSQVVPGHLPRQKEAIVLGNLVDTTRPGEEVVVTGIYETKPDARLNAQTGFPVLASHIFVNHIEKQRDFQIDSITEEDFEIIHKLSQNPCIREKIIDSIAPSLWGHRHIKTGLAYSMFGGVPRRSDGNHAIRGDINVLILGDPGMGKSQFLKYVEKTFDRTIYTTGKGASGVGLTAAMRRDPVTREWCLEGGGLVLADEGICLIDEFDKMGDQDRVSIHEAMEQQTISISKAGIITTLQARCAIIAAANPILGRYNSSLTFAENVNLSDPILSRFDILAIVKDHINPAQDESLAQYVVGTHIASHPSTSALEPSKLDELLGMNSENNKHVKITEEITPTAKWITGPGRIPQVILKKYIIYARRNCKPELLVNDEDKLAKFYSDMREASVVGGGMPMTVRHLESIIRMATANAKMRLASSVDRKDMDYAISTMLESFIQSQKHAVAISLGKRFGKYRALATSPDEFLENVLVELLSRKSRELLRTHYRGELPTILGPEDVEIMESAKVSLAEWITVVQVQYGVPGVAVHRYAESRRFGALYCIHRSEETQDSNNVFVSKQSQRAAAA